MLKWYIPLGGFARFLQFLYFLIRDHDARVGDAEQLLGVDADGNVKGRVAEDAIDRTGVESRGYVASRVAVIVVIQLHAQCHDRTREAGADAR